MEKKTHLQGIGEVKATEAGNLRPGSVVMWNYGYTSEVLAITPRGTRQIIATLKSETGTRDRILGVSTLVAFVSL